MTDSLKSIVIRVDADQHMGIGHVMRCLAFGQYARDQGTEVAFLTRCPPHIEARLRAEHFEVQVLSPQPLRNNDYFERLEALCTERSAQWVLLDGYQFGESCHQSLRGLTSHLAVFDDTASLPFYDVDLIINQNLRSERLNYRTPADTRLLLGVKYAQLRQEFRAHLNWSRPRKERATRLLVTVGGGDIRRPILKILDALLTVAPALEVTLVCGAAGETINEITAHAATRIHECRLMHSPDDMAQLMAQADVAITASGSTLWETAFMELPSITLILAENQREVGEGMQAADATESLGWHEQVTSDQIARALEDLLHDAPLRDRMRAAGRRIVDGLGSQRLYNSMRETMR